MENQRCSMFIIVCFVSYMNKTGFGVMLYMYTYLPYVALCVRGERGERGVTMPSKTTYTLVLTLDYLYSYIKPVDTFRVKPIDYPTTWCVSTPLSLWNLHLRYIVPITLKQHVDSPGAKKTFPFTS